MAFIPQNAVQCYISVHNKSWAADEELGTFKLAMIQKLWNLMQILRRVVGYVVQFQGSSMINNERSKNDCLDMVETHFLLCTFECN